MLSNQHTLPLTPKIVNSIQDWGIIQVIDKSLGFETAVHEEALRAINAEHVVAESIENVYAIPASRNVNRCLIPESTFYFEGPDGIFKFIEKRLKKNGHMVIVIAEGAGQDLLMEGMLYDGPTRSFGKQATPGCWFVDFTIDKVNILRIRPIGGTNFRVLRVQLGGKDAGGIVKQEFDEVSIPPNLMAGTSDQNLQNMFHKKVKNSNFLLVGRAVVAELTKSMKRQVLDMNVSVLVINMEWGNFRSSHLPLTEYDHALDADSLNPGEQEFKKDDDGSIRRCKMHDIVHDVAQYLSKNECCMIEVKDFREESMNALCEKARQLRLIVTRRDTFPISICNFKKLRSLLIEFDDVGSKLTGKVIQKLFDELTCLKALRMSEAYMEHIPKEIGKLIHLRYLDLSNNAKLIKLPETLCELYNLQTLKLDWCSNLEELPQGIGKLINLRHLMNWGTDSVRYMPKGMERLIHLRALKEFHLSSGDYGGKTCSLEFLNNIESLWIKGLKNLAKVTDEIVQLKNNKNIRDLGLGFSWSYSMNKDDEAILEAFQPPPNLQVLTIQHYRGPTMSTLRRMTSLTNLRSITLSECIKCLHMPPLGKLPSLETLVIERMYSVREVGNEFLGVESGEASSSSSSIIYFPNLKTLQFWWMRDWEVWDFGNEDDTCTIMPSLRSLQLLGCSKLKGLPKQLLHQMAPLQNLEIEECYILEEVYSKGKGDKWQDISHIPDIHITGDYTWMNAE
ncbi:hypothetical protein LWI28_011510 [Acer negundo]|uniref:hexokinase n=1 Tax=Acer negundo TaxID=4023 RepID=A0AAD5NIF5_ACENE|nr:hypothetical protein LWI28_011510 [Acer negundo]